MLQRYLGESRNDQSKYPALEQAYEVGRGATHWRDLRRINKFKE